MEVSLTCLAHGGRPFDDNGRRLCEIDTINSYQFYPIHSMGLPYMPISWGGLGGQGRHIWQSHGVFGKNTCVP